MIEMREIESGAAILGSDGVQIGMVAALEGDHIRLADSRYAGMEDHRPQRFIAVSLVDHVQNGVVWLHTKAAEVVSFEAGTTTY